VGERRYAFNNSGLVFAYETLPTGPFHVVSSLYAATRCDNTPYAMDFDHSDIVKPATADIDPYPWAKSRFADADRLDEVASTVSPRLPLVIGVSVPDPSAAKLANAIGDVDWKTGNLDKALSAYTTAVKLDPHNALYSVNEGATLNKLSKYDLAAAKLRSGIAWDPTVAWYHNELCTSLTKAGQLDQAEPECRAAVRLDPSNVDFHRQLNDILILPPGKTKQ
jgi:tetratricopeptide (TPR) repeat protein